VKLELTLGESTSSLSGEFWRASCEALWSFHEASGETYHKASGEDKIGFRWSLSQSFRL